MISPYKNLSKRAFWRHAVAARSSLEPGDLYTPKFPIAADARIATAGSCFAQHIGRTLRGSGLNVLDYEQVPSSVPTDEANRFGYRLYSGRYGNIYTVRQLVQLFDECFNQYKPAEPVWEKEGRYYDALRPSVEPEGLESADAVQKHRAAHLKAVKNIFLDADIFVFTFGLTEAWIHTDSKTVYPTAPGTIAGTYNPGEFSFKNYDAFDVYNDFAEFRTKLQKVNPGVKFVVTVSPVPLTATASGNHVEVASTYSKSVLRAVCGKIFDEFADVDYFPSYEIITSTNNRGVYFESNKRSVSPKGVATAMNMFLETHGIAPAAASKNAPQKPPKASSAPQPSQSSNDVVCEEELLDAFAK